jgi:hypothetical protein
VPSGNGEAFLPAAVAVAMSIGLPMAIIVDFDIKSQHTRTALIDT